MSNAITYLYLEPGSKPPEITYTPASMVVIVEAEVSPDWQTLVSDWIVRSGCLYMMAWGINCSSWDDSVDMANSEKFNFGPIPEDRFVVTTWHSDEPLEEAFWFSKYCAVHPVVDFEETILVNRHEFCRHS